MVETVDDLRVLAESDLYTFACLVCPERVYGDLHKEVFDFLQYSDSPNDLLLLPRSHMKSHCIAVWCVWWITKHPDTSILYVSATSSLAESQLYAIKNILTSPTYTRYWPDMIHPDEGKRERWSVGSIAVDHPKRKAEGVRDMTVYAAGIGSGTTGLHCEVLVPDDVVVPENAYTAEGRRKVAASMSQFASILNTGGISKACGTRYHPADQYSIWKEQAVPTYNEDDEIDGEEPIWNIMERVVEIDGEFLWPRTARADGKMFGFNRKELARISAMYTDRTQFYAQYYNDPNDPESQRLTYERFQYYDKKHLKLEGGNWYYKDQKMNVSAAIDFAYTLSSSSDYSAIVVIGVVSSGDIFVLDIDRFKADRIIGYYDHIMEMHQKWEFPKLRAEVTAAQAVIARDLKDKIRQNGATIKIEENRPGKREGSKQERVAAVLEPRYEDQMIWHYKGGYTPVLEEELILSRPKHDDIKDCLAAVVEIAVAPKQRHNRDKQQSKPIFNRRFGGVAFNG